MAVVPSDLGSIKTQYRFTAFPLSMDKEKAELIADSVIFSHLIDDIVDNKENVGDQQRSQLELISRKFNGTENLTFAVNDADIESLLKNQRRSSIKWLLHSTCEVLESSFYSQYSIKLKDLVGYFESSAEAVGGEYNLEAFQVGVLKVLFAGLVQTTSNIDQSENFSKTYKYLCRNFTGRSESSIEDFPLGVYISWGSGVQNMFASLVEPMDHQNQVKLTDLFDILLAPLVYLMNSQMEKREVSMGSKKELSEGFLESMADSFAQIRDLVRSNPFLLDLYQKKLDQLSVGILKIVILDAFRPYEIHERAYKEVKKFYKSLLLSTHKN